MAAFKGVLSTTQLPPSPPSEGEGGEGETDTSSQMLAYKPAAYLHQQAPTQRHAFTNVFQPYAGNQPVFVHLQPNQQPSVPYFTSLQAPQPRRGSTGNLPSLNKHQSRPVSPLYDHYTGEDEDSTHPNNKTLSGVLTTAYQRISQSEKSTPDGETQSIIPSRAALRYAGLCVLWYTSSALSNNSGKSILAHFRYPVTLTMVQFGFVSVYCVLFCYLREVSSRIAAQHDNTQSLRASGHRSRPSVSVAVARSLSTIGGGSGNAGRLSFRADGFAAWGIRKPGKQALHGTLVMSVFQIAGHVFSSMAIARVPVSTVHTIKALSPLFTVFSYALLFRVNYSFSTYISLIPLTLGVMLACSFDMRANAVGLVCALGSTVIFVSQNIFSKKLLPKEADQHSRGTANTGYAGKLDKVNLLLYSAGMAFLLMLPIWLYTDLHTQLQPKPTPPNPITATSLLGLFLLNGSVHFAQCLLAFSILARSSPVAYSIASLIKRVAVIGMAIVWFGQSLRLVQGLGMAMTFVGLWMYNRAKSDIDKGERKRGAFEKRSSLLLPSTTMDARLLGSDQGATPDPSPSTTPIPRDMSPQTARYPVPPGLVNPLAQIPRDR